MTIRARWDETRALIEAGWSKTPACALGVDGFCYTHQTFNMAECANAEMNTATAPIDWDDTKQAQHDGSRQIYGGMFAAQRED